MNSEEQNDFEVVEDKKECRGLLAIMFSDAVFPFMTSIGAALVLIGVVFDNYQLVISKPNSDVSGEYFSYLETGLKESKFDEKYFDTGFSYYDRKSNGKLSSYGRTETLEDFFVYLNMSKERPELPSGSISLVVNLLDSSRETEPFAALPPEERRLMEQLQIQLKNVDDEITSRTMNELKQVLLARNKEYTKIEEQNAWSLPLSIIGVFLTLVFGIWSTVLSIRQSKSKLSKTKAGRSTATF
ncbi:hypothetical protein ACEO96_19005 [Vibrio anguillarum]|uniref:hypothetical protein n=1 Tax=Vibrio anguillarum TaxID=55601 RepID=UPI003592FF40